MTKHVREADEKTSLLAFLQAQRDAVVRKLHDLDEQDARHPGVPSGTNLLGIVKHLGWVEQYWFRAVFAGEDIGSPWTDDDPGAEWRVDDDETTEDVVSFYEKSCRASDAIVAGAAPDEPAAVTKESGGPTLRWILLHMIEETARHAGHADILRERIDGHTGL